MTMNELRLLLSNFVLGLIRDEVSQQGHGFNDGGNNGAKHTNRANRIDDVRDMRLPTTSLYADRLQHSERVEI